MIGGDVLELERCELAEQIAPGDDVRRFGRPSAVRHEHGVLERRQPGADRRELMDARDVAAPVPVPVDRDQDRGFDLLEPVEHRLHPELGRTRRPDRAEAARGQERDDGLGHIRQVRRDAVAPSDPEA